MLTEEKIPQALRGIRVVELGQRRAVRVCGGSLRSLGATVLGLRGLVDLEDRFGTLDVGKELVEQGALRNAAREADIVILSSDDDHNDGSIAGLLRPDAIICDIRAFAGDPPVAGKWTDAHIQALSGIIDSTGPADAAPCHIKMPITDFIAGLDAAIGILAALRSRRVHGGGQTVGVALFDSAIAALNIFAASIIARPGSTISRVGNRHPSNGPWNLYSARDQQIVICAVQARQWQRMASLIGRPELYEKYTAQVDRLQHLEEIDAAISAWTSARTAAECSAELEAAGIPFGLVATCDDYPDDPNLVHRKTIAKAQSNDREFYHAAPTIRLRPNPAQAEPLRPDTRPAPSSGRPLEGLTVLEFGQYTAVPMSTQYLLQLGAEVIKFEKTSGEDLRHGAPKYNGQCLAFNMINAGKKSVAIDISNEEDRAVVRQLVKRADIFIDNLKPGVLKKFGLGTADIMAENPRIITCSVTGFGTDTIYGGRPAFDAVIQAMSGFMACVTGDNRPMKTGMSTADILSAKTATLAVMAAVERVEAHGVGQIIDISMQDVCAWLSQTRWNRVGASRVEMLQCQDGYVMLTGDAGVPAESFEHVDRETACLELRKQGLDAVQVSTVAEALYHPYTKARGLYTSVADGGLDWPILRIPIDFSRSQAGPIGFCAPALDAHRGELTA